jgi:lipopolysaccharide/colanic/teichoic acid biosynthesis glycosyltransferase
MKRICDLLIAGTLLALSLPLLVIVAFAIWLQNGMPVIVNETRTFPDGRRIDVLKFRTMMKDHPTSVGGFQYYMRIVDLPQLMNVLRGDMSLLDTTDVRPDFFD